MSATRRLLATAVVALALALVTSLAAGLELDKRSEPGAELRSQGSGDSAGWG
ncbi:hypothetical protein [Streptomyces cyaneofuscatus]|uniref:hypothetical protein n=1 Tax=Streptomyces cyaneofuscatus TaxID=66883 RepID=UPI003423237E